MDGFLCVGLHILLGDPLCLQAHFEQLLLHCTAAIAMPIRDCTVCQCPQCPQCASASAFKCQRQCQCQCQCQFIQVSVPVPVPMHSSEAYWGRGPVCALKDCRHRSTRVVGCYIVGGTCSLDGVDTPVTFLLSKHGAGDIRVWCW